MIKQTERLTSRDSWYNGYSWQNNTQKCIDADENLVVEAALPTCVVPEQHEHGRNADRIENSGKDQGTYNKNTGIHIHIQKFFLDHKEGNCSCLKNLFTLHWLLNRKPLSVCIYMYNSCAIMLWAYKSLHFKIWKWFTGLT